MGLGSLNMCYAGEEQEGAHPGAGSDGHLQVLIRRPALSGRRGPSSTLD